MVLNPKSANHLFWPNILLFTLSGIWSPYYYDDDLSPRKRAYRWFSRIVFTLCYLYIVQSVIEFILLYDILPLDDKSEFYSFIFQLMIGLFKAHILERNEVTMRKLFREIEETPFQRSNDRFFNSLLVGKIRSNRKIMIIFWIPVYATLVVKVLTSVMNTRANKGMFHEMCFGESSLLNGTSSDFDCSYAKLDLPWLTWFPFKTDKNPGNWFGMFYQLFCLMFFSWYIFNFDMYISAWMMYIALQFEMMAHDLETLRARSEEEVVKKHNTNDECLITQEVIKGLRGIVQLHNNILGLFQHTQESLSVILLVQYFWISILICMLMIQMSVNSPLSGSFFSAFLYFVVATTQIFVVFYYSNEVKLQSLKLANAAFYCGWHLSGSYSPLLKGYVLFLIRCTSKELRVLAGGVFDVDMVAFLKVMKASYSYFALVRSSHKN